MAGKKLLMAVILIFGFSVGLGFWAGHLYTAKECAPNSIDFRFANRFVALVSVELLKFEKSRSWGHSIVTTIGGPVLRISVSDVTVEGTIVKKFKRNIKIRQEIIEKVLSSDGYGGYIEDIEKIRPLAREIADEITKAQGSN